MSILLETNALTKNYGGTAAFFHRSAVLRAVDCVDLRVEAGRCLGLIGESGCGKSTLGRMVAGLEKPTCGTIRFEGQEIAKLSYQQMRPLRRNIQMIFQNSASSFDPRDTIGTALSETICNFETLSAREASERAAEMLAQVGLDKSYLRRYPRELSGGQRQRANIARALILRPRFVVCDEPVSSLDFSIRRQILDLLNELKGYFGLTYLFISHDLSTVRYVCDDVAVMYLGKVVELMQGTDQIAERICHPYSRALFNSVPVCDPALRKEGRNGLFGEATIRDIPAQGCRFRVRCVNACDICAREEPKLRTVGNGHSVACHRIV